MIIQPITSKQQPSSTRSHCLNHAAYLGSGQIMALSCPQEDATDPIHSVDMMCTVSPVFVCYVMECRGQRC